MPVEGQLDVEPASPLQIFNEQSLKKGSEKGVMEGIAYKEKWAQRFQSGRYPLR